MTRFRALQRGAELRQLTAATDERNRRAGERLTVSLRSDTGRWRRLIHATESSPRGPMVPDGGCWLVVGVQSPATNNQSPAFSSRLAPGLRQSGAHAIRRSAMPHAAPPPRTGATSPA